MMSEEEIREFIDEATSITGDSVTVTEAILTRWVQDRDDAANEARDSRGGEA